MHTSSWLRRGVSAAAGAALVVGICLGGTSAPTSHDAQAPTAQRAFAPTAHGAFAPAVHGTPAGAVLAAGRPGPVVTAAGTVTVTEPVGDRTQVTEYTPPEGLPAAALSQLLTAAGAGSSPGRVAGAAAGRITSPRTRRVAAIPADYSGCSYAYLGTATTLCPMVHWSNDGYAHPQVYFVDHTSGLWPVRASTAAWNRAANIDLYYTTGGCPAGAHCVNVWDGNYGNTCWQGLATWNYDGSGNFIGGSVSIYLNDYNGTGFCQGRSVTYAKNAAGYRQNICHEQGHTLGLDHNRGNDSCLNPDIDDNAGVVSPDAADLALLGWLYSTPH